MLTIILPGFSVHNKDWAYDIASKLHLEHDVKVIEWDHWIGGGNFSLKREKEKILGIIKNHKINIIAKSVGVAVALELIPDIFSQVEKLILCGIASVVNEDRRDLMEKVVSKVDIGNILCIQNERDKYVPFEEAERFYHSVSPYIKVISKRRSDHEYPYPKDFEKFLKT